ncbi:hypothetical protein BKA67DRAFT_545276 [Truncatella angustata]|uniref:Uncharacterized protein n=1 Tax=Truncatella angustata TaxID=152316 RepID=A0A9P8UXA9_9PEZI|nr:uncharacterized protein BKA67DRAFT_545276 [Truncatella angustata]KAH6659654.1 hypothetical protein BKA67DRAFT_545276 [Truncatella angustata]
MPQTSLLDGSRRGWDCLRSYVWLLQRKVQPEVSYLGNGGARMTSSPCLSIRAEGLLGNQ